MKALNFENPFADYGNIVRGERFIGREDSLRIIENRIIRPLEPGNLAIVGEPRIGKSSLVYKSIIERKRELIARKILPVWLNLATYDKAAFFFRSLVTQCYDEMDDLNWLSEPIKLAAQRALNDELTWGEGYGRIQRFFGKVRQAGFTILFILDEFDHARVLFKGDISGFQGLRELSYRPEWRVTFVTTSRRTIREIEEQTQAISTFDGIFHKHYLSMFNETDVEKYFLRLTSLGLSLNSEHKERILFYCGAYPYLLEMLGYEIIELFRQTQQVKIDESAKYIEASLLDQYDRLVELLQEDGQLKKLLQILFGPIIDVKQTDIDEFLRYGLIKLHQDKYWAFSKHAQAYLKLIERSVDLWPVWRKTEMALRQIITAKMLELYGEEWIGKLEKARPHLTSMLDICRANQQKEQKTFGSRASQNLIDFAYPSDLFSIIFAEWNIFKAIFGKDKGYWGQRSELLTRVRNPLAHSRDSVINDYERQIAEGYCGEILAGLDQH